LLLVRCERRHHPGGDASVSCDALADTLERVARELGFRLRFPAPVLATAINASLNGLAFERAADPDAIPDEVFAEFISAVLACAVAAPEADD
jgi:hypothetical protein